MLVAPPSKNAGDVSRPSLPTNPCLVTDTETHRVTLNAARNIAHSRYSA